jgi:hypothetical protein
MKIKNLTLLILLVLNSSICLAVPVGNDLELIPAPRNLGININQASQKLTVNGAVAFTNLINNPSTISSQPAVFVKGNGLYYTSPLHSNPFRLDTNISNGGSLNNPVLSGNVNFSSAILSPLNVNGGIKADLFNGGVFKGDGSLLTGIVPSSLKAPDGSPNPALAINNNGTAIFYKDIKVPNFTGTNGYILGTDLVNKPISDGFRMKYGTNFFGLNRDALIFDKTDLNARDPDGGIAFVNTGNDGIAELAIAIRGSGNTGIGTINPSEKLEVAGNIKAVRFIGNGSGLTNISTSGISNLSIDSLTDAKSDGSSIFLGDQSGRSDSGGNENIALGYLSLTASTTAKYNTVVGAKSLWKFKNGNHNTAVGHQAMWMSDSGEGNTAIGSSALSWAASGSYNTAVGTYSLSGSTQTGSNNTAVGVSSLSKNTNGFENSALGKNSLSSNTTGFRNTAVGVESLFGNSTGYFNTASGFRALKGNIYGNSTGSNNTATGAESLSSNTSGNGNTATGVASLIINTTGSKNTATGINSLFFNTTGSNNTASGNNSLYSNTTGSNNIASGTNSLYANTTGVLNSAYGTSALQFADNGSSNNTALGYKAGEGTASNEFSNGTFLGFETGSSITTGDNNILIGYRAGDNISSGATNLIIGFDNDAPSATGSNQIDIADTIFGNSSTRNVGIGINNTSSKLTVNGDFALREISSTSATSNFGDLYVSSADSELYFDADDANPVKLTNNGSLALNEVNLVNPTLRGNVNFSSAILSPLNVNGGIKADLFNGGVFKGDGSLLTGIVPSSLKAPDGSPNPALQVDNAGRIGIGTSTPEEAFIHLKTPQGARIMAQHSDESFWSEFTTAGVNNTGATIKKWSMGSLGDTRLDSLGGKNKFYIYQYTNKNDTSVNGYRMVIDDNGNTGFGTLTPTQKLEVAGNIKANNFIGNGAGLTNIPSSSITNMSIDGLVDGKSDSSSVFLGSGSGNANSGTTYSTAVGIDALKNNDSDAINNTAVGFRALMTNNGGDSNTAVGYNSLSSNTSGSGNIAIGNNSLNYNTTGTWNTAIGFNSLIGNTWGNFNTAVGFQSLNQGYQCTAVGAHSLSSNTTGQRNTAVGDNSLFNNTAGLDNIAMGTGSLLSNTTGSSNTASGASSMSKNNTGSDNTGFGVHALSRNIGGNKNTALGARSGFNVKGSNNITIGADTLVINANGDNQINIGNLITGSLPTNVNGNPMGGSITISGASSLNGNLNVNGNTSIEGHLDIDGSINVKGKILSASNPWILVHSENFETGASGWDINTTTNCGGRNILGGFGVTSTTPLNKSFDLSAYPHTHVMVKFNYYSLDSWDNEAGIAKIDGLTAWTSNELFYSDLDRAIINNCGSGGSSTSASLGKDLVLSGEARIDHKSNGLTLTFGSSLNEASTNESFGIDNLEIWVKAPSFEATLPNAPSASNNAFCGPNGFYTITSSEVSTPGSYAVARGAGPATASFIKCSNLVYVESGHSVTRTWTFIDPPRSGEVKFKIERRRTGSPGIGFRYWFPTNVSGLPQPMDITRPNADIFINCNYIKGTNQYQCNHTIINL